MPTAFKKINLKTNQNYIPWLNFQCSQRQHLKIFKRCRQQIIFKTEQKQLFNKVFGLLSNSHIYTGRICVRIFHAWAPLNHFEPLYPTQHFYPYLACAFAFNASITKGFRVPPPTEQESVGDKVSHTMLQGILKAFAHRKHEHTVKSRQGFYAIYTLGCRFLMVCQCLPDWD